MENSPLVSVIVITYNSSATVLETLESIKNQSYRNIELVVSDDCSKDDTPSVVKQWLNNKENALLFKRAIFTSTQKNGGPAKNCNNGIKNSTGKWFKIIAADDLLLPDCIMQNVEYVNKHDDIQILISKMESFRGGNNTISTYDGINWNFWKLSRKQQYHLILLDNWITAPSQFVRKNIWEELGGYDENIPFIEDWPFWIRAFKAGVKFGFLDEPTVRYRIHESLSNLSSPSKNYQESLKLIKEYVHKCQYEISPLFRFFDYARDEVRPYIFKKILDICNPYYWYIRYIYYQINNLQ